MEIKKEKQDKSTKLTLFLGDEPVSHLWVIDHEMRIGSSIVRMGGIAGVWTEERHRLKGYASKVLNYSLEFMKEEGYDVSLLFGIPNFYHRFGYATVLPSYTSQLETRNIPSFQSPFKVEPYGAKFKEALLAIYNKNNEARSGTLVRSPQKWETFTRGSDWSSQPIANLLMDGEEVVAYIVADAAGEPFVIEVGYREPAFDIFSSLLAQIKLYAEAKNSPIVRLALPPDDPFLEFCQRFDLRLTIEFPLNREGMGRIINLATLFSKIQENLWARLSSDDLKGRLVIQTDIGEISLPPSDKPNSSAWELTIPQHKLLQLMMGYRRMDDILLDEDVSLKDPQALPLLRELFPKGFPHLSLPDRF